jgi:hypothetical protein
MAGRDGSSLLSLPVPRSDSAGRPAKPPTGRAFERGPDLAALHLRCPEKHVTQVRTTSFLR